jgi:hypothetical protein
MSAEKAQVEALGPADLEEAARDLAERSADAQGLPARVTERSVIERVARLVGASGELDQG